MSNDPTMHSINRMCDGLEAKLDGMRATIDCIRWMVMAQCVLISVGIAGMLTAVF